MDDEGRHCLVFSLLLSLAAASAYPAETTEALDIGSRLELFVDEYLIESMEGVRLNLHEPRSAGTIISFDKPWEGNTSDYHTVFRDGDSYRMYYAGTSHPDYADQGQLWPDEKLIPKHKSVTCLIESKDGIQWSRPSLGLIEFEGSKDNNIVWRGEASCCFAPFKDGNPDAPTKERYKALSSVGEWPHSVLKAFISADGKSWRLASEKPAISDGKFDSLNVPFWDPVRERLRGRLSGLRRFPKPEVCHFGGFSQLDPRGSGQSTGTRLGKNSIPTPLLPTSERPTSTSRFPKDSCPGGPPIPPIPTQASPRASS